eukprot:2043226-Pleurochrysis_carterae.AAC.1
MSAETGRWAGRQAGAEDAMNGVTALQWHAKEIGGSWACTWQGRHMAGQGEGQRAKSDRARRRERLLQKEREVQGIRDRKRERGKERGELEREREREGEREREREREREQGESDTAPAGSAHPPARPSLAFPSFPTIPSSSDGGEAILSAAG